VQALFLVSVAIATPIKKTKEQKSVAMHPIPLIFGFVLTHFWGFSLVDGNICLLENIFVSDRHFG
jgi:hypothetical protein